MSDIDLAVCVSAGVGVFLLLWSAGSWAKPDTRNIYDQQAINRRWSWFLVACFASLVAFLGVGFDVFLLGMPIPALGLNVDNPFPWGSQMYWDYASVQRQSTGVPWVGLMAFTGSGMMAYYSYSNAPQMVLAAARARSPNLNDPKEIQLVNIVRELCIASGLPAPKIYVVPDPDLNAFACGTGWENAHIAVTEGLLAKLNREELQGVLAHELSHVKNADVELMTMVVALAGAAALLSDWASRGMRASRSLGASGKSKGGKDKGGAQAALFAIWILLIVLAPLISRLMAMAVSRKREYLADATGAEITRNPVSLASALEKIRAAHEPTQTLRADSFAHLCIDDPSGSALSDKEGFVAEVFSTHPPISKRIAALKEMAYLYAPKQAA